MYSLTVKVMSLLNIVKIDILNEQNEDLCLDFIPVMLVNYEAMKTQVNYSCLSMLNNIT